MPVFTTPLYEHGDPDRPGPYPHKGGGAKKAALSRYELEEALLDVGDIPAALKSHGLAVHEALKGAYDDRRAWSVVLEPDRAGNILYVVSDGGDVKEAHEWVHNEDPTDWIPEREFNKEFWEFPGPLYHATTPENAKRIDRVGLEQMNKTRGLTNRSTGAAVFTSTDPEAIDSYGNVVYEIDTAAMKRDGYTPEVSAESGASENELRSALAHRVGLEDWWTDTIDPGGEDPSTVVIFGGIPRKYLKRMD